MTETGTVFQDHEETEALDALIDRYKAGDYTPYEKADAFATASLEARAFFYAAWERLCDALHEIEALRAEVDRLKAAR